MNSEEKVGEIFKVAATAIEFAGASLRGPIVSAARSIALAYKRGGIVYACGNGGSEAHALHLVAELVGRFEANRPGIGAVALGANSPAITAIANDFSYAAAFARQVSALCTHRDVLVAFSTSGLSNSVINAANAAREKGATVIAVTGRGGGMLAEGHTGIDVQIIVPSYHTARIQEVHQVAIHAICALVDELIGGESE